MSEVAAPSYRSDILPLFRGRDVECMAGRGIFLDDYAYMADPSGSTAHPSFAHANDVLGRLNGAEGPQMPPDGPWPAPQIEMFQAWIRADCPP